MDGGIRRGATAGAPFCVSRQLQAAAVRRLTGKAVKQERRVEGREDDGRIRELRRVSFATRGMERAGR